MIRKYHKIIHLQNNCSLGEASHIIEATGSFTSEEEIMARN